MTVKGVVSECVGCVGGGEADTQSKIKLFLFVRVFCAKVIRLGVSLSDGEEQTWFKWWVILARSNTQDIVVLPTQHLRQTHHR